MPTSERPTRNDLYNDAVAAHDGGDLATAQRLYAEILETDPSDAATLHMLGLVYLQEGGFGTAAELSRRAIALRPDNPHSHNNLGQALNALGRRDEAMTSFREAVALDPSMLAAWMSLFEAHYGADEKTEAIDCLDRAIGIAPGVAELYHSAGTVLCELGRFDDAVERLRHAIALRPEYVDALVNLGFALMYLCRHDEAAECLRHARTLDPASVAANDGLLFLYTYMPDIGPQQIYEESRAYGDLLQAAAPAAAERFLDTDPDRPLRVGFVSGDFSDHPIGTLLRDVMAALARPGIEIFAYATKPVVSNLTAHYHACIPNWRDVWELDDDQLCAAITADRIDVLIDLAGYTDGNRLPVFARKPAPVQVTWLGYVATTGLSAIDYVLCDRIEMPGSEHRHFAETPWYLPGWALCYGPPDVDIEPGPPPSAQGASITFGSFNNLAKLNDSVIELWSGLLRAVPASRLFLKSSLKHGVSAFSDLVTGRFAVHGIDPDRIAFEGHSPKRKMLAAYNQIDVALDTAPFPGVTTTLDALWMGAPVITLAGDRFGPRMSDSILAAVGHEEWIASGPDAFIEIAAALAGDTARLKTIRETLRGELLGSAICDAAGFAENLADAFRGMWREYCNRQREPDVRPRDRGGAT